MMKDKKGLTTAGIALIIVVVIVLAGIIIFAINPGKQAAETRNLKRNSDVSAILTAVYNYAIENNGVFPASVPTSIMCPAKTNEICKAKGNCVNMIDLAILAPRYLASLPVDPKAANGTGYHIAKNLTGKITVCAPRAENNATISATR